MGQISWYQHFNSVKNEDAQERYTTQSYRCFDVLEGQLKKSGGKSILPGGFSAVDCHFFPWVVEHRFGELDISKYPLTQGWLSIVKERPEVKAAYSKIRGVGHSLQKN